MERTTDDNNSYSNDDAGIQLQQQAGSQAVDEPQPTMERTTAGISAVDEGPSSSTHANRRPQKALDRDELSYAFGAYHSIYIPVCIAMITSSLAVNFITTEEWADETQESLESSYTVVQASDDASASTLLGKSLLNGLVIIAAICGITFVVVALLYFKCIKVLYGYMVTTYLLLFGLLASQMFQVAIDAYQLRCDVISFWLVLYNFAVVGAVAIFWPKGFPRWTTQAYLIASSVLVAWQLSQFDTWTGWVLIVLLAFYDLFAVLTPCGPLRALVNVMQKEGAPSMPPGLLFEARIENTRPETRRKARAARASVAASEVKASQRNNESQSASTRMESAVDRGESKVPQSAKDESDAERHQFEVSEWEKQPEPTNAEKNNQDDGDIDHAEKKEEEHHPDDDESRWKPDESMEVPSDGQELTLNESMKLRDASAWKDDPTTDTPEPESHDPLSQNEGDLETLQNRNQGTANDSRSHQDMQNDLSATRIPLAIARLYKLRLVDDPNPIWRRRQSKHNSSGDGDDAELPTSTNDHDFTVEQLNSMVDAIIPRNGGRVEPLDETQSSRDQEIRYKVIDRHGNLRRVIFVGAGDGKIYQDKTHQSGGRSSTQNDRIRLGLGDFVFYSVLTSLASQQSFVSFCACFVAILSGLLATLLVLAMTKHALPALPISIFAAVVAFVLTQILVEDFVQFLHIEGAYV